MSASLRAARRRALLPVLLACCAPGALLAQCIEAAIDGPPSGASLDDGVVDVALGHDGLRPALILASPGNTQIRTEFAPQQWGAALIGGPSVAVALSGPLAAATSADGRVHAYARNSPMGHWTGAGLLDSPDALGAGDFGHALALDGDLLAASERTGGGQSRVHVYRWYGTAWFHERTIDPPAAGADGFGASIALASVVDDPLLPRDVLVVGAPHHAPGGAVHVYTMDYGWHLRATGADFPFGAKGGSSVDVDGEWVVAGAPSANQARTWRFTGSSLFAVDTLDGSSVGAGTYARFGESVALYRGEPGDSRLVVGAPGYSGPDQLVRGGMFAVGYDEEAAAFVAPISGGIGYPLEVGFSGGFGSSVDVYGSRSVCAAPDDGPDGSLFVQTLEVGSWHWSGAGGGSGGGFLSMAGSLCPGEDMRLELTSSQPLSPGILVVGLAAIDLPLPEGVLVPSPDVLYPVASDNLGDILLQATLGSNAAPATEVFFQVWMLQLGSWSASNAVRGVVAH